MKNKKRNLIITSLLTGALAIPSGVSAYEKSFTFTADFRVIGKTQFDLSNRSTNITAWAQTYTSQDKISDKKVRYSIALMKSSLSQQASRSFTANGSSTTQSYGLVPKNTYTVNIYKNEEGYPNDYISGTGKVRQ